MVRAKLKKNLGAAWKFVATWVYMYNVFFGAFSARVTCQVLLHRFAIYLLVHSKKNHLGTPMSKILYFVTNATSNAVVQGLQNGAGSHCECEDRGPISQHRPTSTYNTALK